jgi:ABC-2 type transport system permease protein
MVSKILTVAKREYLERVRSKLFLVTTFLVPVLLAGVMLVPMYMAMRGGASPNIRRIRIIDATGAGVGQRIADALKADSALRSGPADTVPGPFVVNVSQAEIKQAEEAAMKEVMKPKSLVGYLVIDDTTLSGHRARYAGRNASTISDVDKLHTTVRQVVMMHRLEKAGVSKETVDELSKFQVPMPAERITDRGRGGSGASGLFAGVIVGVMLLMSIIIHGQNVMRGVLEEKTTRVAEIVISSIKPEQLLAGKVLGVGGVGLTQIVAWLGLSVYLTTFFAPIVLKAAGAGAQVATTGVPTASSMMGGLSIGIFAVAIVYFLLGFLFYATLFAAAGSMVNSEQEAQQAIVPIMILIMSGWIFLNPVLLNPNSRLAVVLSWLPWASPIIMPIRMGLTTVSPLSVAGSILCALIGSLGAMWLAARIYRVGMLMYGKKPTMKELGKWIRYA